MTRLLCLNSWMLSCLLCVILPRTGLALDCRNYRGGFFGSVPVSCSAIDIAGTRAYVADVNHLKIIDITDRTSPSVVGDVTLPDIAMDVAVSGNHAFVADRDSGLIVVDVSNATSPTIVGSLSIPGSTNAVAAAGTYVYVTHSNWALQIIDISDPTSPVTVGSLPGAGIAVAVSDSQAVSDSLAFVANGNAGVQIIDISNPSYPVTLDTVDTPGYARAIAYYKTWFGSRIYVADGDAGVQVIDVSDPAAAILLDTIPTLYAAISVDVNYVTIFVAESGPPATSAGGFVEVIGISVLSNPIVLGNIGTPGRALDVKFADYFIYVAAGDFQIYDPGYGSISPWGSADVPGSARSTAISGSLAYIAAADSGLQVFDVSYDFDPLYMPPPTLVGGVHVPGNASHVAVEGNHAYVLNGNDLTVIDITTPASPVIVGSLPQVDAFDIEVSGDYVYLSSEGLKIVDVSDPTAPVVVGSLPRLHEKYGLAVSGQVAYLLGEDSMAVIDISNPTMPEFRGSALFPTFVSDVAVSGTYAYVTTYNGYGVQVVDITSVYNPFIVGSVGSGMGTGYITVSGSFAYTTDYWNKGMQVFDISDPASPTVVGWVYTEGAPGGLAIYNNYVFVAAERLLVFPIHCNIVVSVNLSSFTATSQPNAVLLEWATSSDFDVAGFHVQRSLQREAGYEQISSELITPPSPLQFVDADLVPGVTYFYRLDAVDRTGAHSFFGPISGMAGTIRARLDQSRPNPFSGNHVVISYVLPKSGEVSLRILDISGRQVRQLLHQRMESGENEAVWDGRNDRGVPVSAGTYFYSLEGPGVSATKRLIKLD